MWGTPGKYQVAGQEVITLLLLRYPERPTDCLLLLFTSPAPCFAPMKVWVQVILSWKAGHFSLCLTQVGQGHLNRAGTEMERHWAPFLHPCHEGPCLCFKCLASHLTFYKNTLWFWAVLLVVCRLPPVSHYFLALPHGIVQSLLKMLSGNSRSCPSPLNSNYTAYETIWTQILFCET